MNDSPYTLGEMILAKIILDWSKERCDDGYREVAECWSYMDTKAFVRKNNICSVEDFIKAYKQFCDARLEEQETEKAKRNNGS